MKPIFITFLFFFLIGTSVFSQENYWVFFTDKNATTFQPYEYFDAKAIERRINCGISLYDSTDFPVNEIYKNTVNENVVAVTTVSRWFNAVSVVATTNQIEILKTFPFVKNVQKIAQYQTNLCSVNDTSFDDDFANLAKQQLNIMNGNSFKEAGFDGKGIRIAVFDGGFPEVNNHEAFEYLFDNNQIKLTWDFTKNNENVYHANYHGTMVLSNIAGKTAEIQLGLATGAEFLLARTEVNTEPFVEEKYWLAAVEWADKNGADIINSSLGYTSDRYFIEDMDGVTSLVARAANLAARKGILVVNAMGNDGDSDWKMVGTPADADSVLSIGGIDPSTGIQISFSSFGPTADGRLKPNVSTFAHAAVASPDGYQEADGTSFASPLAAGFAACAWQAKRQLTNMELMREIEKSATLFPYYDYAHGYGIPQANYFTEDENVARRPIPTFTLQKVNEQIVINIIDDFVDSNTVQYLYFHIADKDGKLKSYKVIQVFQKEAFKIDVSELNGNILRVHFKGYTEEMDTF